MAGKLSLRLNRGVALVIVAGILILINIIGSYLRFSIDLTEEKRYTLTDATKELLSEVAQFGVQENWLENFQQIFERLKILNSQCTNMDFKQTSKITTEVKGFDDKCALCVVITKVI